MKNEQYTEMYQTYQQGFSLAEVGKMFGMSRQSVYQGFKCRAYTLREKKQLPFLMFNGIKFTLRNHGYYARTDGDRDLMHRYIWQFYNGEIPDSHDIHHINRVKTDNRIENFELMTKANHASKYGTKCNGVIHRCGK